MGCSSSITKPKPKPAGGNPKDLRYEVNAAKQENLEYAQVMKFLNQVPLFKRLPVDYHPILAASCTATQFKAKQIVITQGDVGNEFFVIRSGEAIVQVDDGNGEPPRTVATLKNGDYFGEAALLRDDKRNATIIAETDLLTLTITRDRFESLELNHKLHFPNRKAVGQGGLGQVVTKPPCTKTAEDKALISKALRDCTALTTMVTLDEAKILQMIDVAWKEDVDIGKEIITVGDLQADYFYIVAEGEFEVCKPGLGSAFAPQGTCFGELALLYFAARAATVVAKVNSVVWVIDRCNFKKILMRASKAEIERYAKYLEKVEILSPLLKEERKALAEALLETHYKKGEKILQQGEQGNCFYMVYEGEVAVIKDGKVVEKLHASADRGQVQLFGERSLLENVTRNATVEVCSPKANVLKLDRESFNLLLGPLEKLLKKQLSERGPSAVKKRGGKVDVNDRQREKILRKDLVKVGLLGCGGFGTVEL